MFMKICRSIAWFMWWFTCHYL